MKRNNILLTIAALLMLCACSKEKTDGGPGGGLTMRVVPSLAGDTKASIQTADLQEFYLQLGCTDAAFSYFGKVSKSGTAWSATKHLFWKDETTPVSVCAAYFGGHAFTAAEFSGGVDLAVPADQSTQAGLNGADLLTLPAASVKYEDTESGLLPVELGHGLAKVNFVITLGDAVYDANIGRTANPITAFTVKGANTSFNFKPQTGTVTVTAATQADITPLAGTYTPGAATAKTATALYEAILVPQSFAAGELSVTFSVGAGNYTWSNVSAITLSAGKTYNLSVSVTTAPPKPMINGHEYVDLGLPSGLKWATCNVGAAKPEDYGDYFAWGETTPKSDYSWDTYFDTGNGGNTFAKYTTDKKTVLDAIDDAATANWGKVSVNFEPAADEGNLKTIETVIWQNDVLDNINWSGKYRFAREGRGTGEEIYVVPADQWEKMKTGTFYVTFNEPGAQIRITTGWWSTTWTGNDFFVGNELVTDNEDGTYTLAVTLAGDPIVDLIDDQHLLFTGGGYIPLKIFFAEQVAPWRMPTYTEWKELWDNCSSEWTSQNGVNGRLLTSKKNQATLFLPAAGIRGSASLYNDGSNGCYWSSSLDENDSGNARYVEFYSGGVNRYSYGRYYGQSVRPVTE